MNKKIVITGASSEIGLAICKKIIKPGDEAILHCFQHEDKCSGFKKDNCKIVSVNFNNDKELAEFCNILTDIDILINAAACTITDLLPNISGEDISRMINVNIRALVKICQKVIPAMLVKRYGCIVNISSISAQRGNRGQNVYAGTKGFVESFTRALAAEYGAKGIRINCVAPGPIESGSLKELLAYGEREVKESIVSGRLGRPEDVAAVVEFLCGDGASYINGKCISVDGGFLRGI